MNRKLLLPTFAALFLAVATGCVTEVAPTLPAATAVQETLNFMLSQVALQSPPTATPKPSNTPTASSAPQPSETPTEIATVEFITDTPNPNKPTPSGPTPTIDATLLLTRTLTTKCIAAFFVGDVGPIQDGSKVKPNQQFTKTWDVRNIGTCTWDRGFKLVFRYGQHMQGPDYIKFSSDVPPNGHIFLTANLIAPATTGLKEGQWYFRSSDDVRFGVGEDNAFPLYVRINVVP
jgi:hypothetical protein